MMTKDEAKEYIQDMINEDDLDFHGEYLVDKIYNNFERRTCVNCKHWTETVDIYGECEVGVTLNSLTDTVENFGCNKFERKTDGNV